MRPVTFLTKFYKKLNNNSGETYIEITFNVISKPSLRTAQCSPAVGKNHGISGNFQQHKTTKSFTKVKCLFFAEQLFN